MTTHELQDVLEEFIDQNHLCNAVDALAEVCRNKSEHLACNWQDASAAADWARAARSLDTLAARSHYPWLVN